MRKILLLSDTHGHLDDTILKHCADADEIWHAGDFGTIDVSEKLSKIKKLRAVYGNIDGQDLRKTHPLELNFEVEGLRVMMVHIGGYPGKYPEKVRHLIQLHRPGLFICGHSHILKVVRDPKFNNMLCVNPGAAGKNGFHQLRTMIRMEIELGKVMNMDVIELGKR